MANYCSACGQAVAPDAKFCAGCGSTLGNTQSEPEDTEEQATDDKSVVPIAVGAITFLIAWPVFSVWQRDISTGLVEALIAVAFYAAIKGIRWLLWKGGYCRTLTATAPFTAFWLVIAAIVIVVLGSGPFFALAALLYASVIAVLVGLITRGLAALDTRRARILRERD